MSAQKPKFRYSSKGWFFHAFDWLAGVIDMRNGRTLPDPLGRVGLQTLWVGPFDTFEQAANFARQNAMKPWCEEWSRNA